jgi:hypothetical protein
MGVIRVKDGVQFTKIAPGGFRILSALDVVVESLPHDLEITSGTDGCHSGQNDPHHRGEAYDIHTKGLNDKLAILSQLQFELGGGHFYAFLEDADTDNEHIHVQVKKGTVYPPNDAEQVQEAASGEN